MTTTRTEPFRQRSQLSDEASAYIRNLIMSGQLLPGESVRPELIAEPLGVSTTPVREALQALRVEGFLELLPRRGFIVAPLTGSDIRDIFTAHALIAGELAARAARNATPEEIATLAELHESLLAAARSGDLEGLEQRNHQFHREVNRTAEARKLGWVLGVVGRYVPHLFYSTVRGWPGATIEDHSAIMESIAAGNAEQAREAMTRHIIHAGELLAQQFDERTVRSGQSGS
ncbi:MAG TPA: GntR family transcriptional regulator [Galbitalea sp.]|nr:GntR family transcriptional regulator [Galbitalea sp.]